MFIPHPRTGEPIAIKKLRETDEKVLATRKGGSTQWYPKSQVYETREEVLALPPETDEATSDDSGDAPEAYDTLPSYADSRKPELVATAEALGLDASGNKQEVYDRIAAAQADDTDE